MFVFASWLLLDVALGPLSFCVPFRCFFWGGWEIWFVGFFTDLPSAPISLSMIAGI